MYGHNIRRGKVTTMTDNIQEHIKVSYTAVKPLAVNKTVYPVSKVKNRCTNGQMSTMPVNP